MFGYNIARHPILNLPMICLWSETERFKRAEVRVVPEYGSNICSYTIDGIEYLHQGFFDVAGMKFFGIPILYPYPNRVDGCKAVINGTEIPLPDTDNGRTLHGLVAAASFSYDTPVMTDDSISVKTSLTIGEEHVLYPYFPVPNRLELTITLSQDGLTVQAKVTNLDGAKDLPFGFGVHPFFNVIGLKNDVLIRVPATGYMENQKLIPTGNVLPMEQGPADLRKLTPLTGLDLDDLWLGMTPLKPIEIIYQSIQRKMTIFASDIFTHAVTYTPQKESFFCLENQTCATNAHRLHHEQKTDVAHLLVLHPGETMMGKLRFSVEAIREP